MPGFFQFWAGKSDKDIEEEITRREGLGQSKSDILKDLIREGIASKGHIEKIFRRIDRRMDFIAEKISEIENKQYSK